MKRSIKEIHKGTAINLLKIYGSEKLLFSEPLWISLIITFLVSAYFPNLISNTKLMKFVIDSGYKIIPSVLGLAFAAFGIIISITNSNPISSLVNNDLKDVLTEKKIGISTFQKILAVISWAIFIQSIFLISFILVEFCFLIDFNNLDFIQKWKINIIRISSIILLFLFLYSIMLIPRTVINLFNYGQLVNSVIIMNKIKILSRTNNKKNQTLD